MNLTLDRGSLEAGVLAMLIARQELIALGTWNDIIDRNSSCVIQLLNTNHLPVASDRIV